MTFDEWFEENEAGLDAYPDDARKIWKAATLAERERCAKVCEGRAEWYQKKEGHKFSENQTNAECGCGDCADAIRKGE